MKRPWSIGCRRALRRRHGRKRTHVCGARAGHRGLIIHRRPTWPMSFPNHAFDRRPKSVSSSSPGLRSDKRPRLVLEAPAWRAWGDKSRGFRRDEIRGLRARVFALNEVADFGVLG